VSKYVVDDLGCHYCNVSDVWMHVEHGN
jgi:hypothetical protein